MRLALVAPLVLALLAPVSADALTYREGRALQVARQAWRTLPCGGAVTILRQPTQFGGSAEAVSPCAIIYDPTALRTAGWPTFCTMIVHEVGHLLGYRHTNDPRNVMYPDPMVMGGYWRCQHSRDWEPG